MSQATLSRGLLTMKFMQKSKLKIEKEKEAQESQKMYAAEITDEMKKEILYITELSRGACESVVKGRFSFGGVNPEIERIMAEEEDLLSTDKDNKFNETTISDEGMANHYSSLYNTLERKFHKHKSSKLPSKNRKHPYKKPVV